MDERLRRLSKTLAYVLRHRPDSVGIELDSAGWVDLPSLLSGMVAAGHVIDQSDIDQILLAAEKRRYELRAGRIRAAQGHSVDVDLGLAPEVPPAALYHETVERFLDGIRREGLLAGARTHVHLSADISTARAVGGRRGSPVLLRVNAAQMHTDGYVFMCASNGVWLVDHVPPRYLV